MRASAEPRIGGATHVVGIVGWPVEHSLSPVIHNAAFAAAGTRLDVRPAAGAAGAAPCGARTDSPRSGSRGANVTMPHKTEPPT